MTGGGTGGHITPLLAVAQELKSRQIDDVHIVYVGEKGSKFADLTKDHSLFDSAYTISAGKFRRYHGESILTRITDVSTLWLNTRDVFRLVAGFFQSLRLLKKERPDIVLLKGGFVGVPVGLAAAWLKIPFITHDSDALPGLANRIVGRWARIHATGMPARFYSYDPSSVAHVGVLLHASYTATSPAAQKAFKKELQLPTDATVLFVTGGSLGAQRVNVAVAQLVDKLLESYPSLHIFHQVGKGNVHVYGDKSHPRLHVYEFLQHMHIYSGAADVIITRAGANTLAEFGAQGKACIVVPNPYLTGGHQLKNAEYLSKLHAIRVVDESSFHASPNELERVVRELLDHPTKARALGKTLQEVTITDATERLSDILLNETAKDKASKS